MNYSNLAKNYKSVAVETASPGKLILMLFDGALRFMAIAEQGFEMTNELKRHEVINNNIIKAQNIIAELQGSIDLTVEGEFPQTMYRLYEFVFHQLQAANLKKNVDFIKTSEKIIREIRDAWAQMLLKQEEAPDATVDTLAASSTPSLSHTA